MTSYGDGALADHYYESFNEFYDEQLGYGVLTFHDTTHSSYSQIVDDYSILYKDHVYAQPIGSINQISVQCGSGLTACGSSRYNYLLNEYTCNDNKLQQCQLLYIRWIRHTLSI